ncbi:hypothetical protein ACIBO9_35200 [Streptomyces prunicolor]|uniref:hypothetical protein n=1 Tax=Streptomyces prunicolor TaxID=67348 RepID=UPI0037D4A102
MWSNDFWNTVITVIATLFVGAFGYWATVSVSRPRRLMQWHENLNADLLRVDGAVTVMSGTATLSEPRLLEIHIKNAGTRDLVVADFVNGDDSLIFDCGAPIVDVLLVKTNPSSTVAPDWQKVNSDLHVKPFFIVKGQSVKFRILTDGPTEKVKLKTAQILETQVRNQPIPDFTPPMTFKEKRAMFAVLGTCAILVIAVPIYLTKGMQGAYDQIDQLKRCRYWDVHDPERAKNVCPTPTMPSSTTFVPYH